MSGLVSCKPKLAEPDGFHQERPRLDSRRPSARLCRVCVLEVRPVAPSSRINVRNQIRWNCISRGRDGKAVSVLLAKRLFAARVARSLSIRWRARNECVLPKGRSGPILRANGIDVIASPRYESMFNMLASAMAGKGRSPTVRSTGCSMSITASGFARPAWTSES